MFLKQKNKTKNIIGFEKGVSIIEALVLIFVFSISALAFYSVFSVAVHYITNSKNKVIAVSLANERMELLRNLGYEDVAIDGGIPDGDIDPDEYVTIGDNTFHLITDVRYYDDPEDGTFGGTPNDSVPNDYKIVSIVVYWGTEDETEKATLSSRFVPPGVETSAGGGTLSLNAIDFSGSPVSNVSVNIFNDQVSPVVDYTTTTDSNGNLLLQGVPGDVDQNYKIIFSKSGHETVTTYSPPDVTFIPEYGHVAIVEGSLNERTMKINLLSDLSISSVDPFGNDIENVGFTLTGGKRLDDGTSETPTYNYTDTHTTNLSGVFSIEDISPGTYEIEIGTAVSDDYVLWKGGSVDEGKENTQELNLSPADDMSVDVVLADKLSDSVLVKVADSATGSPIEGAQVNLINNLLGVDITLDTDEFGNVYFPEDESAPLQNGETYSLEISAMNYDDNSTDATINGLVVKEVNLISI
jgi:type II secretory pathway pseudopilin PulG